MTRTIIHIVLGTLLWVVFCFYWHLVMQQPITGETERALVIVGTVVAAITLFDWFWIFHNVRIARRTRRRGRRAEPPAPTTDFLGRTFMAQDDVLHRAHYIEVYLVEMSDENQSAGHKLFRVSDTVPEDP
jgi:hypothetical protein